MTEFSTERLTGVEHTLSVRTYTPSKWRLVDIEDDRAYKWTKDKDDNWVLVDAKDVTGITLKPFGE